MKQNAKFRFLGYKVEKIRFEINSTYKEGSNSAENATVALRRRVAFHKEKPGIFLVSLVCFLNQADGSAAELIHPYSLELTMTGKFEAIEAGEQELEMFTKINAPAMLYPYLRSAVTQIVTMSGFEPVVLPIMNFLDES